MANIAAESKKYLDYDPDAHLRVIGNADERDSNVKNKPLTEGRAKRVKDYLVSLGISDSKIDVIAQGDEEQIDANAVKQVHAENPTKTPKTMDSFQDLVWAYNRRVDTVYCLGGYFEPVLSGRCGFGGRWPNHKDRITRFTDGTFNC